MEKKWKGLGYDTKGNIIYKLDNTNQKVKEYNDYGELIFEGEYLYGERYRKGKEYYCYDGTLKFEGEYLNGKRNGKGREYNKEGDLVFEGEYLNGKRLFGYGYDNTGKILYILNNKNGKGKEYNDYGKIIFEGEYLNRKKTW